jgi:hypothetical protein
MSIRRPEQTIQRAVFEHLAVRRAPGTFAFHVPNGGWRSRAEAAILKGLGVVAGVPDVILVCDGRVYALELKALWHRTSSRRTSYWKTETTCTSWAATCSTGVAGRTVAPRIFRPFCSGQAAWQTEAMAHPRINFTKNGRTFELSRRSA